MARLEIVGGIGAGKTTLARVLAEAWGSQVVHEDVLDVPFFSKFYAAPQVYGFEKNISFLLSHADLIRDAEDRNEGLIVCDFALFQDLSYTDIGCSPADADAVEAVYRRLVDRVGHPALVVHLRCTPDTQLRRIVSRGRSQETGIARAYLVDLCAAIDRRLEQLRSDAPGLTVIEVDTDEVDYATNPAAANAVARELIGSLGAKAQMLRSRAGAAGDQA
jgi:deoxyadenosine/deoxycytidine kinase